MKKIIISGLFILSAIIINSCDTRTYDEISPKTDPTVIVTYNANVKSIIDTNCKSCHSPDGGDDSPYLTNYAEVKSNVDAIITAMKNTSNPMPPNGLLPASTVNTIIAWKTAGTPEK